MKTHEITIVIPVYNAEEYLSELFTSLDNQSYKDFEVIFVNDGSTDGSLKLLEGYCKSHKQNVKIVTQKNRGPGAARNTGLELVSGEYLVILDADDVYEQDSLKKLYERAIKTDSDIVVCRADEFRDIDNERKFLDTPWTINRHLLPLHEPFSTQEIPNNFFEVFVGWTWDKIFRTKFIRESGLKFQELRSTDDAFFTFMALLRAKKIATVDDVLVHHRKVNNSVSATRETSSTDFLEALTAIRDEMKQLGIYQRFERDFINYAMNFSIWNLTSLSGTAYSKLHAILKKDGWRKFGVLRYQSEPDYFYSKWHYDAFKIAIGGTPQDLLFFVRDSLENDVRSRDQLIAEISRQLDNKNQSVTNLEKEIKDVRNSTAWKVGRAITVIPRKAKSLFRGE